MDPVKSGRDWAVRLRGSTFVSVSTNLRLSSAGDLYLPKKNNTNRDCSGSRPVHEVLESGVGRIRSTLGSQNSLLVSFGF